MYPPLGGCLHQAVVHGVRVPPLAPGMQVPLAAAGALLEVAAAVGALVQHKTRGEVPVHGRQVLRKTRGELQVVGRRVQLNHGEAEVHIQDLVLVPLVVGDHLLNRAGGVPLNKPADGTYNVFGLCVLCKSHIFD
jgi:hypothetical protein